MRTHDLARMVTSLPGAGVWHVSAGSIRPWLEGRLYAQERSGTLRTVWVPLSPMEAEKRVPSKRLLRLVHPESLGEWNTNRGPCIPETARPAPG